MKLRFRIAAILVLVWVARAAPAQSGSYLVVPGQSIGQTCLGPNGSVSLGRLPRPTASDDGMSQEHLLWTATGKGRTRQTLYIHTTSNGALGVHPLDGVTIDEIRVTSSVYRTRGGLHTGSPLSAIRRQFPKAHPLSGEPQVYADTRQGIAFEFSGRRCIAVAVYPPNHPNVDDAAMVAALLK